jgi:hypothetical protein
VHYKFEPVSGVEGIFTVYLEKTANPDELISVASRIPISEKEKISTIRIVSCSRPWALVADGYELYNGQTYARFVSKNYRGAFTSLPSAPTTSSVSCAIKPRRSGAALLPTPEEIYRVVDSSDQSIEGGIITTLYLKNDVNDLICVVARVPGREVNNFNRWRVEKGVMNFRPDALHYQGEINHGGLVYAKFISSRYLAFYFPPALTLTSETPVVPVSTTPK